MSCLSIFHDPVLNTSSFKAIDKGSARLITAGHPPVSMLHASIVLRRTLAFVSGCNSHETTAQAPADGGPLNPAYN
jgi:hypothetical protein